MRFFDLTLNSPAENLALDEALLDECEESGVESFRLWESPTPMVVLGRGSKLALEVNREACAARRILVTRRCSGGASVLAGPGCLMYAVVLDCQRRPELKLIDQAHQFVLRRIAAAAAEAVGSDAHVRLEGLSDLAFGPPPGRKFSGNSLRYKRRGMLYHGTLLYAYQLDLIEACLLTAPRQPDYREGRRHGAFVDNLPGEPAPLRRALRAAWPAEVAEEADGWPKQRVLELVQRQYGCDDWTHKL